ncbi:Isopropylmalate/homocitrate/citramalate synthases [Methanolobus vulcani]|jgi:isopropylmalate/homocitrate/citramalate synthase|uniref:Isopropylmalate/homocitrate/citramalate synthases n=1 Tax=Methanolobus vulcani TaxID=38026 RepID=A0A7Z7AUP8_9EURY|nr:isopropylmalate synthase [Methanolobus vulcani]MDK2947574.1 citrate (Re)-synthase [Methanolobus sp.]SDF36000.1 Isopropylmalate/homocitrate/citramalate synthases [Methanolobus vulcani]
MKIYKDYDDLPKIKLPLGQEVSISDSTIRDGAQMPGIVMKSQQKLQIYEYLHRIGIEKLESFVYNERDRKAIKLMMDHGYEFPEVTGWARANPADIDMVLNIDGIEETGILMSVSDPHIVDKMGLTRETAEEKYLNALQYAVDHGLRTRAHIEDMTRADNYDFTFPLIKKIMDIDPDCTIRICDTIGFGIPFTDVDEPFGVPMITKYLKDELNVKNIETHCHDDFGLAVANSIAGYWHGANWSNVTFLGIGERAGNAEMEKLLLFLARRIEGFDKYNLDCLVEFSRFMEKEIGIRIPRNKSVVGNNVFAHESGIHSAGVIKNPFTYEPYPPEIVGGKRIFLIGDSSGIEVLRYKVQETLNELMEVNIEIDKNDKRLRAIQADIQKLYNDEKRVSCISDEEVMAYVKKYFMFNQMVSKDMHRKDEEENGDVSESSDINEIKPRMHDTID